MESLYQVFDKDKVDLIRNYIDSKGIITTIYDLNAIEEIDINDIQKLKSYISVHQLVQTPFSKRSSYKIERWLSSSENQEGLSENWLDLFFNPMNVNNMNYDDLYSLPNLSPIDVTAVLLQKERGI